MKIPVLLLLMGACLCTAAQDKWTVTFNGKRLLSATEEDSLKNRITLSPALNGSLVVLYEAAKPKREQGRRLMIYDNNDRELYRRETYRLVVPAAKLKQWKRSGRQLAVYTIPLLGAAGANVRLRRVHLCTINF